MFQSTTCNRNIDSLLYQSFIYCNICLFKYFFSLALSNHLNNCGFFLVILYQLCMNYFFLLLLYTATNNFFFCSFITVSFVLQFFFCLFVSILFSFLFLYFILNMSSKRNNWHVGSHVLQKRHLPCDMPRDVRARVNNGSSYSSQ